MGAREANRKFFKQLCLCLAKSGIVATSRSWSEWNAHHSVTIWNVQDGGGIISWMQSLQRARRSLSWNSIYNHPLPSHVLNDVFPTTTFGSYRMTTHSEYVHAGRGEIFVHPVEQILPIVTYIVNILSVVSLRRLFRYYLERFLRCAQAGPA